MKQLIYLLSPLKKEGTIPLPIISFSLTTNFIDFSSCDILMFTSKQAVVSANTIDKNWKNYPCFAIGEATKNKIIELGGEVIYQPKEFYAQTMAKDIAKKFSDKKFLYLRPKEVSFDSKAYLEEEGVDLSEQVIYETSCVSYSIDKKPKENAIIIFTSPSSIRCFFKNFQWHSSYMAVLIGNASKKKLPNYCNYVVSDAPLIESCVKKAKEMLINC